MNKELFEKTFLGKTVRAKGEFYDLPPGEYIVTAALYKFYSGDVTVLAILHKDYTPDNCQWYTIYIAPEHLPLALRDFEVLD